jgi:predicted CoA-binding protein
LFPGSVLAWYHQHSLPVTPLNPKSGSINLPSKSYPAARSISDLSSPAQTSLSIVTPPKATMQVLREAKEAGVPAVFLQPGTFNDEVMQFAKNNFEAAIGGEGGNGGEGWCVLMDGEEGLQAAGVKWTVQKL